MTDVLGFYGMLHRQLGEGSNLTMRVVLVHGVGRVMWFKWEIAAGAFVDAKLPITEVSAAPIIHATRTAHQMKQFAQQQLTQIKAKGN